MAYVLVVASIVGFVFGVVRLERYRLRRARAAWKKRYPVRICDPSVLKQIQIMRLRQESLRRKELCDELGEDEPTLKQDACLLSWFGDGSNREIPRG